MTEQDVVDVQLLDRECQSCDIVADSEDVDYASTYGTDRFLTDDGETGVAEQYDEYPFDIAVEVREDWLLTIEQQERYTVETTITDVDVTETDEVESRDVDVEIDVDTVHQQLLNSDLVELEESEAEDEVIDAESYDVESEYTEDDVLTTYLTSPRQFEREISDRSRFRTEVVEGELLERETVGEEVVEANAEERVTDEYDTYDDAEGIRVLPEEGDEGKQVVDTSGDEMGEVIDVSDGVAYVDPHHSLTEKILSRLGVDEDEEYYRLHEDRINRITDNEIVISTGEGYGLGEESR